jgi:hypothetical protein
MLAEMKRTKGAWGSARMEGVMTRIIRIVAALAWISVAACTDASAPDEAGDSDQASTVTLTLSFTYQYTCDKACDVDQTKMGCQCWVTADQTTGDRPYSDPQIVICPKTLKDDSNCSSGFFDRSDSPHYSYMAALLPDTIYGMKVTVDQYTCPDDLQLAWYEDSRTGAGTFSCSRTVVKAGADN